MAGEDTSGFNNSQNSRASQGSPQRKKTQTFPMFSPIVPALDVCSDISSIASLSDSDDELPAFLFSQKETTNNRPASRKSPETHKCSVEDDKDDDTEEDDEEKQEDPEDKDDGNIGEEDEDDQAEPEDDQLLMDVDPPRSPVPSSCPPEIPKNIKAEPQSPHLLSTMSQRNLRPSNLPIKRQEPLNPDAPGSKPKERKKVSRSSKPVKDKPLPGGAFAKSSNLGKGGAEPPICEATAGRPKPRPLPNKRPAPPETPATPATKRPRRESYVPGLAGKYRRSQHHWRLDGNLLVQIGKTRYNLHRSQLVKFSSWFQEQLADDDEKSNTKKVKYMSRDGEKIVIKLDKLDLRANDFEALLDAFDDAVTWFIDPPPYPKIMSILTAAHILGVQHFEAWAKKMIVQTWGTDEPRDITSKPIPYAMETVLLSRKCDLPLSVLKRAFYELSKKPDFDLGLEQFSEDFDEDAEEDQGEVTMLRMREKLSMGDVVALIKAREALAARWAREGWVSSQDWVRCCGEGVTPTTPRASTSSNPASTPVPASTSTLPATSGISSMEPPSTCAAPSASPSKRTPPSFGSTTKCTSLVLGLARSALTRLILESEVHDTYRNDVITGYGVLLAMCGRQGEDQAGRGNGSGSGSGLLAKQGFCEPCIEQRRKIWKGTQERQWKEFGRIMGIADE